MKYDLDGVLCLYHISISVLVNIFILLIVIFNTFSAEHFHSYCRETMRCVMNGGEHRIPSVKLVG